ncbi:hypothetical protein BDN70DRAFT_869980 [Pholiota conissans]|uniref:Uncharacterized protein n=1 Tax=Pholiota conissans TaxID=109636 RepID=A0A9P5ZE75_9AGAR|nr:hypothetical protein BDN70DRAFT_869980 [Pholiota conissans]
MTLLGGLFSRKHKPSPRSSADDHASREYSAPVSDPDSALSSPSSYVTPARSLPSNPNASNLLHPDSARHNYPQNVPPTLSSPTMSTSTNASSGSSRLRLFGRKKSAVAETYPSTSPEPTRRSFQITSRPDQARTSSEIDSTDRRLRPPPSRSAIFAAYGDPNSALSTRSLPTETTGSPPNFNSLTPPPPVPPKKSSIFAWGKHNANATSPASDSLSRVQTSPLSTQQDPLGSPNSLDGGSSFNLRSFRHVQPHSPTGSNVSLTPPIPRRPRGESVNSDASQRISVAAFREAQARRSQAGSPSPSFRSESPAPHLRGKSPDALRVNNAPRPSRSTSHIPSQQQQQRRRSSMAINTTSDSDSAASSSEEDSEDDDARPGRRVALSFNRVGKAGKTKAKSEIGHGFATKTTSRTSDFPLSTRVPNSHVGHSFSPAPSSSQQSVNRVDEHNKSGDVPPRSQSGLGVTRQRASVSASAISPSMAAKRASIVAASNVRLANDAKTLGLSHNGLQTPQLSSRPSQASLAAQTKPIAQRPIVADSSSDSEDDAPLATLVAPRRPGSAMSSYSNPASRSTGNVTTRSATHMPPKPLIDINELTGPKRSYTSPLEKSTAGFTEGPTLLAQSQRKSTSPVHQPSPLVDSPVSMHQQPPWQVNGGMGLDKELLTATVAPIKFATPMTTPAMEKKEFISNRELDAHMTSGDANHEGLSVRRDSSPETRRDPITDRLSRAVKSTLQTPSPTPTATASVPSSIVVSPQTTSPPPRATSPNSGSASETSSRRTNARTTTSSTTNTNQSRPSRSEMPFPRGKQSLDASPPDEELAQLLGTAVQFLSDTEPSSTPAPAAKTKPNHDETSSESSSSDSDSEDDDDAGASKTKKSDSDRAASKDRIAPIPIKQRSPPPSFSVTSRPPVTRHNHSTSSSGQSVLASSITGSSAGNGPRQRSTTLQTPSSNTFGSRKPSGGEPMPAPTHTSKQSTTSLTGNAALVAAAASASTAASSSSSSSLAAQGRTTAGANALRPPAVRQRSSTMITGVPLSAQMNGRVHQPPEKPFAMRRNSPASSTGDSSSGRAPLTPKDGSDIGAVPNGGTNGTDGPRRHIKRRSVSFEDDLDDLRPPNRRYLKETSSSRGSSDAENMSNEEDQETRRKERRRGEAKAAIELGNVVNGRGPILDDDDDMPINQGVNQRMSAINPIMAMANPMAAMQMNPMGFPGPPNPAAWANTMSQPTLSPAQFMVPPPADPNFLAAHQHAMAIAKQAYQMAVAQQAMAAAADEWERGSTFGGGSVYGGGGGSVYGGGGGGGVYGGSQLGTPYNMMGGMPMMQGGGWYGGSGARSMYGGSQLGVPNMMSSSRSEYGGGSGVGGGNWSSSRSSYGESFGPEQTTRRNGQARRGGRDSGFYPPMPTIVSQPTSGRNSPDQRAPARSGKVDSPHRGMRKAPPPSSWKAS